MTDRERVPLPGNRWDLLGERHPTAPPSVSVIVAHYEQPAQLARTLRALRHQTHPASATEVIVVDDGSAAPPAVPSGVRLIRQEDRGFRLAAARNLGASVAGGDVLAFLDADTTPEPDYLRRLVRLPWLAPDCVVVGRRRHADLTGAAVTDDVRVVARDRELPEPLWLRDAYRRSDDLLQSDHRSYRYVIGAVLACSRLMFDAAGGFDEGFDAYGGEDWEWAYRAWLAGGMLAHVPSAVAWHDGPDLAGRDADSRQAKNAEALRLARLIPVPGSRPRALPIDKVDIAVSAPTGASAAQLFVAVDSVLAEVPGAAMRDGEDDRFDRVRLEIEILRPVRVSGDGLRRAIARIEEEQLGEIVLADAEGVDVIRIASRRAAARAARWDRRDLFPTARAVLEGVEHLVDEPDVEAYLGGW